MTEEAEKDSEELKEKKTENSDLTLPESADDVVSISSAEALTSSETLPIVAQSRARVVLVAGEQKSGKTTLIASIFLCFQRGPFADLRFEHSATLRGLERRSWLSRTASMGSAADTERTRVGSRNYLHLKLKDLNLVSHDLLFCDLSGEIFERVINSPASAAEIEELDRIDHLTLLIDGAKVRRLDQRQGAQRDARLLLRGLLDAGALSRSVPIEVVFTKIDLLTSGPMENESDVDPTLFASEDDSRSFIESIRNEIEREFKDRADTLRFFETVARDKDEIHKLGAGIDGLLQKWIGELRPPSPTLEPLGIISGGREIDKFSEREMGS